MEQFYIGQIFENTYPPEAAMWANENNAYIEETELNGGVRGFEIKEVAAETEEQAKIRRSAEIKAELEALDLKSIRAIRANDAEYIAKYETDAQELRAQLAELN